jgi:hypothetical protein
MVKKIEEFGTNTPQIDMVKTFNGNGKSHKEDTKTAPSISKYMSI